jgi:hypothetical protein
MHPPWLWGQHLPLDRGDRVVEPRITAAALDHLLLCGSELLQNLLIDTARRLLLDSCRYRSGRAGPGEPLRRLPVLSSLSF